MHRMVIHAEVYESNAHAAVLPDEQWSWRRAGLAVEQQPVVFHVHGVGHGARRQHGVLLQMNEKVVVHVRCIRLGWMHDEAAQHAGHLLHCEMRVIEEGSGLVNVEFVDKSSARLDRVLADARHAVHIDRNFKAMPVHRGRFGQVVVDDNAHAVALIYLNGWPGCGAVVSPQIEGFVRQDRLLHRLCDEVKDLDAVVHDEGQVSDIGGDDRHVESSRRAGAAISLSYSIAVPLCGVELCAGEKTRADAHGSLKKTASIAHNSSL